MRWRGLGPEAARGPAGPAARDPAAARPQSPRPETQRQERSPRRPVTTPASPPAGACRHMDTAAHGPRSPWRRGRGSHTCAPTSTWGFASVGCGLPPRGGGGSASIAGAQAELRRRVQGDASHVLPAPGDQPGGQRAAGLASRGLGSPSRPPQRGDEVEEKAPSCQQRNWAFLPFFN